MIAGEKAKQQHQLGTPGGSTSADKTVAIVVFTEDPAESAIQVTGKDIALPNANARVEIDAADGSKMVLEPKQPEVIVWKKGVITLFIKKIITKGTIKISMGASTLSVPIEAAYLYSTFSIPRTPETPRWKRRISSRLPYALYDRCGATYESRRR